MWRGNKHLMEVINMAENKKPIHKIKCGAITATIWENDAEKDGKKFKSNSVEIVKNYMKDENKWDKTSYFNINELPKAALAAQKAYEFLSCVENSKEE